SPIAVEVLGRSGRGRTHRIAAGEAIEAVAGRQVADFHLVALGRILHVDVPIVHAAVDLDIADGLPRCAGRAVAADLMEPQYRPGGVPMLPHRHLGPLDAPPA